MSNKVTYIEDLFDLDDVHPSSDHQGMQSMEGFPPQISQNFDRQMRNEISERESASKPLQGRIRKTYDHRMAANAGMAYEMPPPPIQYPMQPYQGGRGSKADDYLLIEPNEYEMGPRANVKTYQNQQNQNMNMSHNMNNMMHHHNHMDPRMISCIDIVKHIKNCPICTKFYDNDRHIYIITIVILVVLCIILVKKLVENMNVVKS
jgi:hypothetical protein